MEGKIRNPFAIGRGVRQRDSLSVTLLNVALHKALENLEQSNTILNRLTQICGYADDILIIAWSIPALEAMCTEIHREAGTVDLAINPVSTIYIYMRFSPSPVRRSVKGATIQGVTYRGVAEFVYLGTLISNENSVGREIHTRMLAGSRTYFAAVNRFRSRLLSRATKIKL